MNQQVVSIGDFAKAWGVSRSTVYRWLRENRIIARKSPSGRRVISASFLPEKPLKDDPDEAVRLSRAAAAVNPNEKDSKSIRRW